MLGKTESSLFRRLRLFLILFLFSSPSFYIVKFYFETISAAFFFLSPFNYYLVQKRNNFIVFFDAKSV